MALADSDATALSTLNALEQRLDRLTFYLCGDDGGKSYEARGSSEESRSLHAAASPGGAASAQARIAALENKLSRLASRSTAVRELLQLQTEYPNLLPEPTSTSTSPDSLPAPVMKAAVLAHAPLYAATNSQLQSLKDLPLPPASASAALIGLHPRLTLLEERRERQAAEVSELRDRSAKLLQRWYEIGVLGRGECWQEWDERVGRVEQKVRREETRRERDQRL